MVEYVKWCSSVEDRAEGSFSNVETRTRRYSENILFIIFCFLDVNSRRFRVTHFLKAIPKILIAWLTDILYVQGSGVRSLSGMNSGVSAIPAPRRSQ